MPPEIHLFVLWEHARPWTDRIIADVERTFRILDAIELRWTPERAARHFSRLYGQSLPAGSPKVLDCGTGPPLILVVSDDRPIYGRRRKWGTTDTVNTHLFDAKRRYRARTGGSRVHCTTDTSETEHDLFLLLGLRSADFSTDAGREWDRAIRIVERDLTGDRGWPSVREMLMAVELTAPYVRLPDLDDAASVRLLVSGLCDRCGVEWVLSEPDRHPDAALTRRYPVVVDDRSMTVEIRRLGDGHHRRAWQQAMLDRRRRDGTGVFVLDPDDAVLELAHALIARDPPTPGDVRRLDGLARTAGYAAPPIDDKGAANAWLESALRSRGYGPDPGSTGDHGRRSGIRAVLTEGSETVAVVAAGFARDGLDRVRRSLEVMADRRRPPANDPAKPD
jgi:hypothetical protein